MKKIIYISASMLLPIVSWAQQDTSSKQVRLQEFVIKEINPSLNRPITFSTLEKQQLRLLYYGADVPTTLQYLPSINAYSDNGTGIGYSFFRMRGIDQTRINTTINGIPVNDPENQGVFFANFADLLSGVEDIQVQRGLGTSTNGSSAFGGSIQINLAALEQKKSVAVNLGVGSFGSNRMTLNLQSGLIKNKWLSSLRLGRITTNGFRENARAEVNSYQISVTRLLKKGAVRFNSFGGATQNKLSYLGLDKQTFDNNPTSNPFVNGESDAFRQMFNQVQYFRSFGLNQSLHASAYFVRSVAPKFQFLFPASWGYTFDWFNMPPLIVGNDTNLFAGDMMTSYRLDQKFYGAFVTHTIKTKRLELNSGIHANYFEADHFMEALSASVFPSGVSAGHEVYRNTGKKKELSAFSKLNYAVSASLSVFTDLQMRYASFGYQDQAMAIRPSFGKVESMSWLFLNPRLGFNYKLSTVSKIYAYTGLGFREPTRFDYLQDDFAPRDVKQNEIKPEQIWNTEVGYRLAANGFRFYLNLYLMEFTNQIVGTGALNNFGYPITGNIGRSWRRGLESELVLPIDKMFSIFANFNVSMNGAKEFTQTFSTEDFLGTIERTYKNVPLAFSPTHLHMGGVQFRSLDSKVNVAMNGRFVGKQYLDNTGNDDLSLPSFTTIDLRAAYKIDKFEKSEWQLSLQLNNILNARYAPSGSLGGFNTIDMQGARGQFPLFLPAAGTNFFLTLSARF